jgi:uncharacterized protein YceK
MKKRAVMLIAAAVLQGCASQIVPMNPESSAALKQAPVVRVVR